MDFADKTVVVTGAAGGIGSAAVKIFAEGGANVVLVDIDPQALTATRDNAERNAIDAQQFTLCYPEQLEGGPYPIVTANILAGPLVELSNTIAGHVAPGGRIALSGILANQATEVREAYEAQGLYMDEPTLREGWVRLTGRRPA